MGGKAFEQAGMLGEPRLHTPRMPPDVYHRLRDQYQKELEKRLGRGLVDSLREAPGKSDYGDIDFVAHASAFADRSPCLITLANEIGAVAVIVNSPKNCSFAVHSDGTRSSRPAIRYVPQHHPSQAKSTEARPDPESTKAAMTYTQIDFEVVEAEEYAWHHFCGSYSDVHNILGRMLVSVGLSLRHDGLYLRLRELGDIRAQPFSVNVADEQGMIPLTHSPSRLMEFLHLSESRYNEGFNTMHELYEWLCECRFLRAMTPKTSDQTGKSTASKRQLAKRPVFAEFIDVWLPTNRPTSTSLLSDQEIVHHRDEICLEAMSFFQVTDLVVAKRLALRQALQNSIAASLLRPLIMEHGRVTDKNLGELMKGFRRWSSADPDGNPYLLGHARPDSDTELYKLIGEDDGCLKKKQTVSAWVRDNWETVKSLERRGMAVAERRKGIMCEDESNVQGSVI